MTSTLATTSTQQPLFRSVWQRNYRQRLLVSSCSPPNDELSGGHDLDWGNGYGAAFALDYEVNERNTIGAKVQLNLIGDYWDFAVPVYWKYILNY